MNDNNSEITGKCEVCRQPTERRCSACNLVFYCTAEHQKKHWKLHKDDCRPYEICYSTEMGRYLQATRDLAPGDILFSEEPLVFGPKHHRIEEDPFPCVGCSKQINKRICQYCPECGWPACNEECEGLKDNNRHALECRVLKLRASREVTPFFEYFRFDILIILRVLFLQKLKTAKWNKILTLENHMKHRGPNTEIYKLVQENIDYLEEMYLKPLKELESKTGKIVLQEMSHQVIHKIYGILDVNATELTEEISAAILYSTTSLVGHNCVANTYQIISPKNNLRITFKAALPITKGSHITSIYTNILWGTPARREHLKLTKYFSCDCNRCKDPTEFETYFSGLKCLGTDTERCGGIQLPLNPTEDNTIWKCNKCRIELPNDDVMKFVYHLGDEVNKVLENEATFKSLEELLTKLLNFLHPNHYHIYAIKHCLVQLYGSPQSEVELSSEFLNEKLKMCEDLIGITRRIDPGNTRLSLYLAVLKNEEFNVKFTKLQRSFEPEKKHEFAGVIKEISQILGENKELLQRDLESSSSSKLYEVITEKEELFRKWLTDNKAE